MEGSDTSDASNSLRRTTEDVEWRDTAGQTAESRYVERLRSTLRLVFQTYRKSGPIGFLKILTLFPLLGLIATVRGDQITNQRIRLDISNPSVELITKGLLASGEYEKYEIQQVDRYIAPGQDIVELGAGIGFLSCYVDKNCSPRNQIAVEANPNIISNLETNRTNNESDFSVLNRAYFPGSETIDLSLQRSFLIGSIHRRTDNAVTVPTVDLLEIKDRFDLSEFALIVDIEGAEAELLSSEIQVLEDHCNLLIIEYHPHFVDNHKSVSESRDRFERETPFELLEDANDRCVYWNTSLLDQRPASRRLEGNMQDYSTEVKSGRKNSI